MKGVSTTIWIVVVALVALVAALGVIWIFFGSLSNFMKWITGQQATTINQVSAQTALAQCSTACATAKGAGTCSSTNPPTVKIDLDGDFKTDTVKCDRLGTIDWGDKTKPDLPTTIQAEWGGWNLNCCG